MNLYLTEAAKYRQQRRSYFSFHFTYKVRVFNCTYQF